MLLGTIFCRCWERCQKSWQDSILLVKKLRLMKKKSWWRTFLLEKNCSTLMSNIFLISLIFCPRICLKIIFYPCSVEVWLDEYMMLLGPKLCHFLLNKVVVSDIFNVYMRIMQKINLDFGFEIFCMDIIVKVRKNFTCLVFFYIWFRFLSICFLECIDWRVWHVATIWENKVGTQELLRHFSSKVNIFRRTNSSNLMMI